jgi:hypothetical protein
VELLTNPDIFTFSNMREEAQFLADVIKVSGSERVLWGLDREIFSDRYLISRLAARVPASASAAFIRLKEASAKALARFQHIDVASAQGRGGTDPLLRDAAVRDIDAGDASRRARRLRQHDERVSCAVADFERPLARAYGEQIESPLRGSGAPRHRRSRRRHR